MIELPALDTNLTVRLDARSVADLRAIAEATNRSPSELARDWLMERLAATMPPNRPVVAIAIEAGAEASASPARLDENERLRRQYRPDDVIVMLVGESAPAGGTFFYQTDSHLFRATREAFERALGRMPDGSAFLDKFKEMGFWLYDMAAEPVNRKRGRPRKLAVSQGVERLARLLADTDPDFVIAVKTSLEGPVRQAAARARIPAHRLLILPFPLYQWREEYVRELARFLTPAAQRSPALDSGTTAASTLHAAMQTVLREAGGGPMPARQLANEIATRGLYHRRDGGRADYQQLLLRAKNYPTLFDRSPDGISLR